MIESQERVISAITEEVQGAGTWRFWEGFLEDGTPMAQRKSSFADNKSSPAWNSHKMLGGRSDTYHQRYFTWALDSVAQWTECGL